MSDSLFRSRVVLAILIMVWSFWVPKVAAHGGVEKSVGGVTIFFSQNPISPLVGETVRMNFLFKDKVTFQNLIDTDVALAVIDTYRGDERKDKKIFEKIIKTDANGSLDFEYRFEKENHFDIELTFPDQKGQILTTGFLILPRQVNNTGSISLLVIVVVFILGFFTRTVLHR